MTKLGVNLEPIYTGEIGPVFVNPLETRSQLKSIQEDITVLENQGNLTYTPWEIEYVYVSSTVAEGNSGGYIVIPSGVTVQAGEVEFAGRGVSGESGLIFAAADEVTGVTVRYKFLDLS